MNTQPKVRKLQPPAKAKGKYLHPAEEPWRRILIAVTNPDLQAVVAFSPDRPFADPKCYVSLSRPRRHYSAI